MPYSFEVCLRGVLEALVAVELQSPGDLLFLLLHRQADGIQDQTYGLGTCRFISCDAVVIKVPDHGQIEDALSGVNTGSYT